MAAAPVPSKPGIRERGRWLATLTLAAACATAPADPSPPRSDHRIATSPKRTPASAPPPAGCPEGQAAPCPPKDSDGDGIADAADACPDDRGETPDGCAIPDRDGDGFRDPVDPCPGEPESDNGFLSDGCPEELPKHLVAATAPYHYTLRELDTLVRTGALSKSLRAVLARLAAILREYPSLHVEIGFHRDAREPWVAYWRNRSGYLPGGARSYLIEHEGIAESRLTTMNYGPDMPEDTNRTEPGRARNRRLEFTLHEQAPQ